MPEVHDRREPLESLTDAELLERTAAELDAFAAFYRRHIHWVLGVAARRTRSAEHAGDLAAEVFASAFLAAGRFRRTRPDGAANTWLFGILLHKLAGFERRGAVERRGRARLRMREPVMTVHEFEMYAAQDERAPSIAAALGHLPLQQQDAVRARVIDECSYDEVAVRLQISEASARKRVSRGLAALRIELEKEAS